MGRMYSPDEFRDMFVSCGFNVPEGKDSGIVRCTQHADRHPSMSITISKGLFHCYSCGYSGFIPKVYRETFHKSYEQQSSIDSNELLKMVYRKPVITNDPINTGFTAAYEVYKPPRGNQWIAYRGLKENVCNDAGMKYGGVRITYTDDEGKKITYSVMDRYIFPIYGEDNTLKSIEMRYPFTGAESEAFKKTVKKCLYPKRSSVNFLYEYTKLDKSKKLYVLEGLMDCLAFRSLTGIKNSTSIFGSQITKHQMEKLNEFSEVCYVFNNDDAGLKSVDSLKKGYHNKLTLLKPLGGYNDVGEMAIAKVKDSEVENWLSTEI